MIYFSFLCMSGNRHTVKLERRCDLWIVFIDSNMTVPYHSLDEAYDGIITYYRRKK